ncbi:MAG TPA: uracil-DNA glycosylase, partial [Blastocatellia bacterium]|nr:uracil-DNA glycosylase [Blastocatellia bacterium]
MTAKDRISEIAGDISEYALYLRELGVEELSVDFPMPAAEKRVESAAEAQAPIGQLNISRTPAMVSGRPPGARLASLPTLGRRETFPPPSIGDAIKTATPASAAASPPAQNDEKTPSMFGEIGPALPETSDSIESIRADIGDCTRCPLYSGRKQIVHSTGSFAARLMFVGEAPGADEDEQGFPFVGRAGQLLTKIIESIGIKREDVFIGNINRCRPPGNRQPTLAEAEACRPFLQREIAVVRPKVIVVLGNTAAQNLL